MFLRAKSPPIALFSDTLESPRGARAAWWDTLWRIPIGSFVVSGPCVSCLKHVAYISGKYSLRLHVAPHGEMIPIFTSPTLQCYSGPSCTLLPRPACWKRGTARSRLSIQIPRQLISKHGLTVLVKATVPMLSGVPSEHSLGRRRASVCQLARMPFKVKVGVLYFWLSTLQYMLHNQGK